MRDDFLRQFHLPDDIADDYDDDVNSVSVVFDANGYYSENGGGGGVVGGDASSRKKAAKIAATKIRNQVIPFSFWMTTFNSHLINV